jgi:hypothetical protein
MEELLNNSWVVGIGGGVLSGLIVTWLTRILFSKKDQRETAMKITSGNQELIYAIRPEISEDEVPSVEVLDALRNATARKYKLDPVRLYTTNQIVEDLIKEIMDSAFISSSTKKSYCESLRVSVPSCIETESSNVENEVFVAKIEYKEKMTTLLSMTLGTIAALATMLSFLRSNLSSSPIFEKVGDTLFPMILVMFSVVMVMTAMQVALKLRHKRIRAEHGIGEKENANNASQRTNR